MNFFGGRSIGCPGKKGHLGCILALSLIFVLIFSFALPASAQNTSTDDSFLPGQSVTKNIAAAIAGASPGSVLVIESGVWFGNFVIDNQDIVGALDGIFQHTVHLAVLNGNGLMNSIILRIGKYFLDGQGINFTR